MGVAGLVILKKRIGSIENTKKLTKAMALVATSKLKKTRGILYKNNSYFESYMDVMSEIIPALPKENKYIQKNNFTNEKLIIVITSDLGMCGSFNYGIVNKVQEMVDDKQDNYRFLVIGEKGRALFKRYNFNIIDCEIKVSDIPNGEESKQVFEYGLNLFIEGIVNEVILVYTWFKNPIIKNPVHRTMLPLSVSNDENRYFNGDEFDIEGDKDELVETLISSYCNAMVFNSMINSKAAEQSYRMETMNSATKNASDLVYSLKLKYNRIRQSAITQEISEIIGGSEAQS